MTSRLILLLVLAVNFAATSNADAKKIKTARSAAPVSPVASCRGSSLFHCGPIYNSDDYLGNDPDPFIRLMIQRDLGVKYGGES
jgi:hypothetical protein